MISIKGENPMRRRLAVLVAGVGLLSATMPVWAHHAFTAEFDAKQPIKLRGTVAKVELINPHSWIHIDVKGDDGQVVRWMVEGGTPNTLLRRGFTKNSADWDRDRRRWLSGQGRIEQGKWPRHHLPRWPKDFPRRILAGRSARKVGVERGRSVFAPEAGLMRFSLDSLFWKSVPGMSLSQSTGVQITRCGSLQKQD